MALHRRAKRDHDHDEMSLFEYVFRPRSLRKCINGVFRDDNENTTDICVTSPRRRPVYTTQETESRKNNIKIEAETFHTCLCDVHGLGSRCRFNLRVIQDNSTVLEQCLGRETGNFPFYHSGTNTNFSCLLRGNTNNPSHAAVCRPIHPQLGTPKPQQTRFQYVLNCLSDNLKDISCPPSTTVGPILTTTTGTSASPQIKVAMLVMALLISLLLGVLGTWLGVFCWRRRKRRKRNNRPLSPLMTRPEHASLPNLYDSEYGEDHIYDVVKTDESPSQPVPDLLSRVPSLPPMGDRTPKSKLQIEPGNTKAAYSKSEDYEPLLRSPTSTDRDSTDPKTPVAGDEPPDYLPLLPDRNSREVSQSTRRVHPYDSINESEVGIEAQDESITTPKLLESTERSPKAVGNDYFILEPRSKADDNPPDNPPDDADVNRTPDKNTNSETDTIRSPNDSGFVVSPDCEQQKEDNPGKSDSDNDSDGYEIPIAEKPGFDIASSFTSKGPRVLNEEDVLDV